MKTKKEIKRLVNKVRAIQKSYKEYEGRSLTEEELSAVSISELSDINELLKDLTKEEGALFSELYSSRHSKKTTK